MENEERLDLVHPGEMLRLDFLEPMGVTPYRLAKNLGVSATRIGTFCTSAAPSARRRACPGGL